MSIQTNIQFTNANDPAFIKAKNGTAEEREQWEDFNGPIEDRQGAEVPHKESIIKETGDEYGGFIIALKDIPKSATHIVIFRC